MLYDAQMTYADVTAASADKQLVFSYHGSLFVVICLCINVFFCLIIVINYIWCSYKAKALIITNIFICTRCQHYIRFIFFPDVMCTCESKFHLLGENEDQD